MIPWQHAKDSPVIASLLIERTFSDPAQGRVAAIVMTALILFVTASSLFAVILGYSRIPFAAARDGQFFRAFERVHPTKRFPHVSLVWLYPIPALAALALWSYVLLSSPLRDQLIALAFFGVAIGAFFVFDSTREPGPGVQAAS